MAPAMSSSSAMGMGMPETFSTSTKVTLFFTDWTTNSPGAYFGTLVFLFFLAILNRFLGAWRNQLSRVWANEAVRARLKELRDRGRRRRQKLGQNRYHKKGMDCGNGHVDKDDNAISEAHPLVENESTVADSQLLSPILGKEDYDYSAESGLSAVDIALAKYDASSSAGPKWTSCFGGRWRAGNPWRWRIDLPRALLEFLRATIGFILMLAVMTFNVGFFFAVTGGILFGELFFGRYTNGTGWEEGGCHDA